MSRNPLNTLSEWQQAFGNVVHIRMWPEHLIVITDPELARELLVERHDALIRWERGTRVFAQIHGNSVIIAEGQEWSRKRRALQANFTPKALEKTVPTLVESTQQTLASWPTHDALWPIESALTSLTMDAIIRTMFSSSVGEEARGAEDAVRVASQAADTEFFSLMSWPNWAPWKQGKKRAIRQLEELIARHVLARQKMHEDTWPDDFLSRLLHLQRSDPEFWSPEAVRDECMTTFLAGHETTAATLTWWAWSMASNPLMQESARTEVLQVLGLEAPTMQTLAKLPFLNRTLEETMRLYPAAPLLMTRRATQALSLGPWQFPARTLFMLPIQLMQGDAQWFTNPQSYWPDRVIEDSLHAPRGAYMPFGAGPRVCLGQHLASAEMKVIAAMMLQRLRLSVPDGMKPPQPVQRVVLRPDTPLYLTLTPWRSDGTSR